MRTIKQGLAAAAVFGLTLTTSANVMAGDWRFCGYIVENAVIDVAPDGTKTTANLGGGAKLNKNDISYNSACDKAVDQAKSNLKKNGVWDKYDWVKKDGNKCSSTEDWFSGHNACSSSCMDKSEKGYAIRNVGSDMSCERT